MADPEGNPALLPASNLAIDFSLQRRNKRETLGDVLNSPPQQTVWTRGPPSQMSGSASVVA